jgi:hypothetical protein
MVNVAKGGAMINVEDFTSLEPGLLVPLQGRVEVCPGCGRNGFEERPECAAPYFLHVQSTALLADGMLTEPVDLCALPPN